MRTETPKDLTRAEALKLAKAKWGPCGTTAWGHGTFAVGVSERRGASRDWFTAYGRGNTWREACERAGLLPQRGRA